MKPVSPRIQRFATFGLGLAVLFILWSVVFDPLWVAARTSVDALDDARFELHRLTQLIDSETPVTEQFITTEKEALEPLLFQSGSVSSDQSAFVATVESIVRDTGAELLQLRAAPAQASGQLTILGVELSVTANEADTLAMIRRLEHHQPTLLINRAKLHALANTAYPMLKSDFRILSLRETDDGPTNEQANAR